MERFIESGPKNHITKERSKTEKKETDALADFKTRPTQQL